MDFISTQLASFVPQEKKGASEKRTKIELFIGGYREQPKVYLW